MNISGDDSVLIVSRKSTFVASMLLELGLLPRKTNQNEVPQIEMQVKFVSS